MEKGNEAAGGAATVQQANPGAGAAAGSGTRTDPGTGTGTEPAPASGQRSGGGQAADQKMDPEVFQREDGTPMTPDELRSMADRGDAYADGLQERVNELGAEGAQDSQWAQDLEQTITSTREQIAAQRAEADRLEQSGSSSDAGQRSGGEASETQQREMPSGSITHPDGTRTEIERFPDGTFRESTVDADGNVLSDRTVERLPGDYARREFRDEG